MIAPEFWRRVASNDVRLFAKLFLSEWLEAKTSVSLKAVRSIFRLYLHKGVRWTHWAAALVLKNSRL
ncbi:hypothetical protein D3C71_1581050 [compost metagenome]